MRNRTAKEIWNYLVQKRGANISKREYRTMKRTHSSLPWKQREIFMAPARMISIEI